MPHLHLCLMTNNKKQNVLPAKAHSTVLGSICFTIIKLLLLTMLAWFILILYLGVNVVLVRNEQVTSKVQIIVSSQSNFIAHYQPLLLKKIIIYLKQIYIIASHFLNKNIATVMISSFEIVAIRFFIFLLYLPLIGLNLLIFIIDGIVQRDIRKFQGAKESAFLFHRLQALGEFSFSILFLIYIGLPQPFQPIWILLPMSILFGLFASFSIKNFKKYL